jgi:hypothetical protein
MDAGAGELKTPSPAPDLIPAENNQTLAENSHSTWNIERGHITSTRNAALHKAAPVLVPIFAFLQNSLTMGKNSMQESGEQSGEQKLPDETLFTLLCYVQPACKPLRRLSCPKKIDLLNRCTG